MIYKEENEEVQLSFLSNSHIEKGLQQLGIKDDLTKFVIRIDDLKKWFSGYKIESIELYIEGVVKDGNITKLFVSFEGKGGCKITLKPDQTHITNVANESNSN